MARHDDAASWPDGSERWFYGGTPPADERSAADGEPPTERGDDTDRPCRPQSASTTGDHRRSTMNKLETTSMPRLAALAAMCAAAFALGACNRTDTATPKTDTVGSTTMNRAGEAMDKAGAAVSDAKITASVNAELAKDPTLSAMKIDVDTSNGRVALKGTAPDAMARERATTLASSVSGVVSVDNQLEIRG